MTDVLESILHLVDCFTNPPRARELRQVRRHLTLALNRTAPDAHLKSLALDLRKLREELARALAGVTVCSRCVQPKCEPWSGGHCCSGSTQAIFTRDELAALKLAGTKVSDLSAPCERPSGCVFRGHQGCSLKVAHRPCLCVRYTCRELEAELTARGNRASIMTLQSKLKAAFEAFSRELEAHARSEDELPMLDQSGFWFGVPRE